jgi:ubiquinone/menaquinone biosynthesis C-methylase UbiE
MQLNVNETGTQQGNYAVGYGHQQHEHMSQRSATNDAWFLMPHLRHNMRLLDCRSGPGTITLGLAETVAPGEVIGIDLSPVQVERASALAVERGVENARFEAGDILTLPFEDASFDVAFANAVLMHLRDPVLLWREMRRVVRPGGLVAVRDVGATFEEPRTPVIEQMLLMNRQVAEATVGRPSPWITLRHRQLLLEAGFTRTEAFADVTVFGTDEKLRESVDYRRGVYTTSEERRRIWKKFGMDDAALLSVADDYAAWAERPDATFVILWSAAIGWVE